MRKIAAIFWKDAIIRFSARSEILFFIVLPILFTVLLSGGINVDQEEGGASRVPLLVVNEDGAPAAAALVSELQRAAAVHMQIMDAAAAQNAYEAGDAPALLTIPAGFSGALEAGQSTTIDLQTEAGDFDAQIASQVVETAVQAAAQPYLAARIAVRQAEELGLLTNGAQDQAFLQESLVKARELSSGEREWIEQTEPANTVVSAGAYDNTAHQAIGQLVTWVFIPLLGISVLFVYERQAGTLRRTLTTPTHRALPLVGAITGQLILALIQMALLIGFGALLMGVNWGQSPVGLMVMLVAFGLAAAALGTTLGTFVRNGRQANNLSILLGMSMALLGGAWFPMEIFPPAVQRAAKILPTTWAMQGLSDLVIRGQGLYGILPEAAVLLAFAVVFLIVGWLRFKYE